MAATAFCVKCRETVELKEGKFVLLKNGRKAIQGVCTVCGTKVYRFTS